MKKYLVLLLFMAACTQEERKERTAAPAPKDSVIESADKKVPDVQVNDSLDAVAKLMAGIPPKTASRVTQTKAFSEFSASFSKRWHDFDSSRMSRLKTFTEQNLSKEVKSEPTLFYPFSGPDILYANLFFPSAEKFVLIGLEPVGTLPVFERMDEDSLDRYYDKLNVSLNAILKFSFFRTESMKRDLKNEEVDGTIHLLLLFLSRTGHEMVSARPVTIDSSGAKQYLASFAELKSARLKSKGVEIFFKSPDGKLKELNYFSLNVVDASLKDNPGFTTYLQNMKHMNTYLKGASYLLHKAYFSTVRKVILDASSSVVQDDSGISVNYFINDTHNWQFKFYGDYSRPIKMFANHYQPVLDSLYEKQGSTKLDFGLGYNYRDKNSNFMIVTKTN